MAPRLLASDSDPDVTDTLPTPFSPEGHAALRPADVAIIGGGPAGLMAAEVLSAQGVSVDLYDAMPSVGRKFLLAGRGGLNLTHAEPLDRFLTRFAEREPELTPMVQAFTPDDLRQWVHGLGIDTFVGTSQRVFPTDMKAAPLLRAWLHRLRGQGVRFHMRHRWLGWADAQAQVLRLRGPAGEFTRTHRVTVLALGGASWQRLGSDGAWVPLLSERGVDVAALQAANCGFDVALPPSADAADASSGWSRYLREKYAGQPIKPVALAMTDAHGQAHRKQGEFVLTDTGVEGSLIYAHAAAIRALINQQGSATIHLDLLPQHTLDQVQQELARPRGPRSLATHLKSRLGLQGLKVALLHELLPPATLADPAALAAAIKALPVTLRQPRPIDEAISTAGGVRFEALAPNGALLALPNVFPAGEMLDWEAPTGGYLLTACMASGRACGEAVLKALRTR